MFHVMGPHTVYK